MIPFTNTLSNVNLSNVRSRFKSPSNPDTEAIATAKTVKLTLSARKRAEILNSATDLEALYLFRAILRPFNREQSPIDEPGLRQPQRVYLQKLTRIRPRVGAYPDLP